MRMSPGGFLAFMPNRQLALPAHLGLETCQALESTIEILQVHSRLLDSYKPLGALPLIARYTSAWPSPSTSMLRCHSPAKTGNPPKPYTEPSLAAAFAFSTIKMSSMNCGVAICTSTSMRFIADVPGIA